MHERAMNNRSQSDPRSRTFVKWVLIVLAVFVLAQVATALPKWTGQGGDGGADSGRVTNGSSFVGRG